MSDDVQQSRVRPRLVVAIRRWIVRWLSIWLMFSTGHLLLTVCFAVIVVHFALYDSLPIPVEISEYLLFLGFFLSIPRSGFFELLAGMCINAIIYGTFYTLLTATVVFIRRWRTRPRDPFACPHCRYDLRGRDSDASTRCPECGKGYFVRVES